MSVATSKKAMWPVTEEVAKSAWDPFLEKADTFLNYRGDADLLKQQSELKRRMLDVVRLCGVFGSAVEGGMEEARAMAEKCDALIFCVKSLKALGKIEKEDGTTSNCRRYARARLDALSSVEAKAFNKSSSMRKTSLSARSGNSCNRIDCNFATLMKH